MKVHGLDALNRKFRALPIEARKTIQDALIKSGDEMVATARALAPVDDGDLRDSIKRTDPGGATALYSSGGRTQASDMQVIVSAGNSKVRYAIPVEAGHGNAAPRPYFWPAYRSLRKRFRGRISRAIRKAAQQVAAGGN